MVILVMEMFVLVLKVVVRIVRIIIAPFLLVRIGVFMVLVDMLYAMQL